MKRIGTIALLLCLAGVLQARDVLQSSDKLVPRWVKYTPKSENPYVVYRAVEVDVDNLADMHKASQKRLTEYLPPDWELSNTPLEYKEVDTYWEVPRYSYSGKKYHCYVLYQAIRPGHTAVEFARPTNKYGFGAVALSIIPGAGQMYKGSYTKGGLIMGGAALCVGGIVLCEATKASYKSLANSSHDANQIRRYTNNANSWATGSYICIGALGALWLYNIIDAAVAPGARRIVVDKRYRANGGISLHVAPTMVDPFTPALTARVSF